MRRYLCSSLLGLLAGAFLIFYASASLAASAWTSRTTPTITQTTATRVVVSPGPIAGSLSEMDRLMSMPARVIDPLSEGGALMRDIFKRNPYLKPSVDVVAERVVTPRAIARAAFRAMPLISATMAAQELMEAARCSFSASKGIVCDGTYHTETINEDYVYKMTSGCDWCPYKKSPQEAFVIWGNAVAYWDNLDHALQGMAFSYPRCVDVSAAQNGSSYSCTATYTGQQKADCTPAAVGCFVWVARPPQQVTRTIEGFWGTHQVEKCDFELVDGQCVMVPTEPQWEDRTEKPEVRPKLPGIIPELDRVPGPGGIFDTEPPKISGPTAAPGGRTETRQHPDGSTTTIDRDWRITYSPGPMVEPWYDVQPQDTTVTWPPGTQPNPYQPPDPQTGNPNPANVGPGSGSGSGTTVPGTTSTTTIINNNNMTTVDVQTCGLPGKPPCKIDESGTPTEAPTDGKREAEGVFASVKACVLSPSTCFPALPSLNWGFTLPSGCSPIPLPQFEPFLTEIDICRWQPQIHDVMSMIWAACGLFAAVRMVGRDAAGG